MQAFYESHRRRRNRRQRDALLDPDFPGVEIDPVLEKLVAAEATAAAAPNIGRVPAYVDPRHCLVFWARPPAHIRGLVSDIQQRLLKVAPSMYIQVDQSILRLSCPRQIITSLYPFYHPLRLSIFTFHLHLPPGVMSPTMSPFSYIRVILEHHELPLPSP
jgi:hypothetical protein